MAKIRVYYEIDKEGNVYDYSTDGKRFCELFNIKTPKNTLCYLDYTVVKSK